MKNKGFTLIELLAVVMILGIIALIAIPTVTKIIEDSRRGAWESAGTNMVKAAETYYRSCEITGKCIGELKIIDSDGVTDAMKQILGNESVNKEELKKELNIKGQIPEINKIEKYIIDIDGKASIKFEAGKYKCDNDSKDSVECEVL